jgi:ABC-type dipeptide/oligopeptide/nickel transport system ATPase component
MLEGLQFRYPGTETEVLKQVDLLLPAGKTVAVVGDNGGGKTTLIKLLCRFYEPTIGRITVDGVDLRKFSTLDWRRRVSAGFQDFGRLQLLARNRSASARRRWSTRTAPCIPRWTAPPPPIWCTPCPAAWTRNSAASSRTASSCRWASGRRRRSAGR